MIELAWPWVFAALPLPLLVRYLLPAAKGQSGAALRVPFGDEWASDTGASTRIRGGWRLLPAALAWILLVAAGARPQWVGEPLELPLSGRDLMLAVDISGSMEEQDFAYQDRRIDRLTATKLVVGDFLDRRQGDRVGLILFGEQAYLQAPLTFDRETVRTLLKEAAIGLAGKATAIGDAIGLAVKRLREREAEGRVLILLTDGANTAGEVRPEQAADFAAAVGLKIYTIGIGAERMQVRSLFGTQVVNPSRELDEDTLTAIAEKTGGRYFRARDTAELAQIYQLLDELEPAQEEKKLFRPTQALYYWPLGGALILAGLTLLIPGGRRP